MQLVLKCFEISQLKLFGFYTYKECSKSCFLGHTEEEITAKHLLIPLLWLPTLYKNNRAEELLHLCSYAFPVTHVHLCVPKCRSTGGKSTASVL